MAITVTQLHAENLTISETEAVGTKVYECTDNGVAPLAGDPDACYAALIAAVPFATAWDAAGTVPFTNMYPVKYTVTRIRCDYSQARVDFSSALTNRVEYEFSPGAVTLVARKNRVGTTLPKSYQAQVHASSLNFIYTRTEIALAWGEQGSGYPKAAGSQQQRVLYCMGRTNDRAWLRGKLVADGSAIVGQEGCAAGFWLFLGATAQLLSVGTHRVTYAFAGLSHRYGHADQILWEYVAPDGSLHEIHGQADFGSVLALTWPTGHSIT